MKNEPGRFVLVCIDDDEGENGSIKVDNDYPLLGIAYANGTVYPVIINDHGDKDAGWSFNRFVITTLPEPSIAPALTLLERLRADHSELAAKCQSIKLYMMTDGFKQLPKAERYNIEMQSRHMNGYLSVLDARIAYHEVMR